MALWQYEFYDGTNKKSIMEFDFDFELPPQSIKMMRIMKPAWYVIEDISAPTIISYPDYYRVLVWCKQIETPKWFEWQEKNPSGMVHMTDKGLVEDPPGTPHCSGLLKGK